MNGNAMSTSSSPLLPDERLAAGAARLASRYAGHFAPETVLSLLADSYARLAEQARIRTHLVVPAERLTAERLDALAHTQGLMSGPTRVLFVCSQNAGRSQMAAALLAHRAGERVTVSSAGTHPADAVEPHIAQALTEAGVDLADAYPKPLTQRGRPGRRRRDNDGLRRRLPRHARPPLPRLARGRP
ncbi:low molecular weight phosphatase family protein [Streptomyces xanthophaeus]|uniref:arsenate-mycothiol transferase ArsC n=1 Tax=Streptomyces xanthophaeus TaxID=67385 RepID=UPI0039901954